MASDPERLPVDDDTIVLEPNVPAEPDEGTQAEQWPVSDLYYVDPDEDVAPVPAGEAGAAEVAPTPGTTGRRFPPRVGVGVLLTVLGVVAALVLGAILLGLDDDPTAARQPTTTAPPPTVPPAETTPAPPARSKIELADVEGMALTEARDALEAQGMRVRVTRSPSERSRGDILSQAPPAGSEIAKGTVVVLVVSEGATAEAASVTVPDVVGMSASAATSAIRDSELEARVRPVPSEERRGTVVDQSPRGGASVAEGTTVRLEVAKPRPPAPVRRVEVPDVRGSTVAVARSRLRAAGLRVTTVTVASQEPSGTVISQSPRAGVSIREDATVKLTVSAGPETIAVPDVTGLDEGSARGELERAGFQVRVTDESITDPAQDGLVLRQTPAGGSDAQEGAVVTLVVGRLD